MLFSRIASYLVGLASVGILATASALPAIESEEKKRQVESVTDILNTLSTTVSGILPQINALNPGDLTSTAAFEPLAAQLTEALTSATTSLSGGGLLGKRADNAQEVATQLAGITTNIANTFAPFQSNKNFIVFGGLLADIDFALKGLIFEVSFLVDGVLTLLAKLLVDVAAVLEGLGFILTVTLIGLL